MLRALLALATLAACTSCPDRCENDGTRVRLVRTSGEFGSAGDRLRFVVQSTHGSTDGGTTATDCTMPSSGAADCTRTGTLVTVVDTGDARVREVQLSFTANPDAIKVTVLRLSDSATVAGPTTAPIKYPSSDETCSCRTGQSITIAM